MDALKKYNEDKKQEYRDRIAELEADLYTRIEAMETENAKLRGVCADAYQLVGAVGGPVEALDNLSAAANGEPIPHDTFLPFRECDCLSDLKELREAAAWYLEVDEAYVYISSHSTMAGWDELDMIHKKASSALRALLSEK